MDGDITMCGEGTGSINAKEKNGFVKEYIETEGLAMILSKEYGLILFHLDSVWVEGMKFDASKTRAKLVPGTEVKFYDKTYKGAEYKELSEDQLIHQAVAVWTGERPDHLLKKIQEEEYKKKLEEHRKSFMLYLRGEVFLRAALVRVKGEVAGYLTDNMGIIEHKDEKDKKINIFFHTDDAIIFKKNIREYNQSPKQLLPVGCLVSVDARRVHISGIKNVEYQVSGSLWFTVVHCGPGSCNICSRQSPCWPGSGPPVPTPLSSLEARALWRPATKYPAEPSPSTTWSWLSRLNSRER